MIILDTNVLPEFMRPKPSARVVAWVAKQPAPARATGKTIEWLLTGKRQGLMRATRIFRSVLHGPDCSQAKQTVVRRDQRKVRDLCGGGQKPMCGITLLQRKFLGDQHDLVGERRFPQGRCGCGQPLGGLARSIFHQSFGATQTRLQVPRQTRELMKQLWGKPASLGRTSSAGAAPDSLYTIFY
jgi:hypothetical protein